MLLVRLLQQYKDSQLKRQLLSVHPLKLLWHLIVILFGPMFRSRFQMLFTQFQKEATKKMTLNDAALYLYYSFFSIQNDSTFYFTIHLRKTSVFLKPESKQKKKRSSGNWFGKRYNYCQNQHWGRIMNFERKPPSHSHSHSHLQTWPWVRKWIWTSFFRHRNEKKIKWEKKPESIQKKRRCWKTKSHVKAYIIHIYIPWLKKKIFKKTP